MEIKTFLTELSQSTGVSGYEHLAADVVERVFSPYVDDIRRDNLGNVIMLKKGAGIEPRPRIMLAAHSDEIGLVVTKVEDDGFIRFTNIGGVDQRILLANEVVIHGEEDLLGVVGAKPPHIQSPDERKKAVKMDDLFIDIGLAADRVKEVVRVGDMITFKQDPVDLLGNRFSGKTMDDRAGIASLFECCLSLQNMKHQADVYFVATVREEVSYGGAFTSTFGIKPDLGIAVDVGHGDMPGVSEIDTLKLGDGPGIGIGPHVHPKIFSRMKDVAEKWNIPYSLEPATSPGGTDAYAIQVVASGIATALISLPLRYMHTPVETLDMKDVEHAGRLMACFISEVDAEFVEGLRCY